MQQFVVPQFIDVEDKILGPITTRQFLIMLAAGLLIFIAYRLLSFWYFVGALVFIGGSAMIFSFAKVNGQSFHYFILNLIQTKRNPSLRVWNKSYTNKELNELRKPVIREEIQTEKIKKAERRHIRDLSLIVNTGGYYKGKRNGITPFE